MSGRTGRANPPGEPLRIRRLVLACALCILASSAAPAGPIHFEDVTEEVGLAEPLARWRVAHGAAWGDVDGDDRPDLYLGAFAGRPLYHEKDAPIPNPLFLNGEDGFLLSSNRAVRFEGLHARTTMALFVDLDGDADLDLVAGNNPQRRGHLESVLFENRGGGAFRDATRKPAPWPPGWSVRNVSALDVNNDGRLDLVFTDGRYAHGSSGRARLLFLENLGSWRFADAGETYGLPGDHTYGLGLAIGDVNNDGVLDIFVAGDNRLFVSREDGTYRTVDSDIFPRRHRDRLPCGAAFGDLDNDDRLDLVVTVHDVPGEFYVYQHAGLTNGAPRWRLIEEGQFPERSQISNLKIRAGHVSVSDLDNDGRRDILIATVIRAEDGSIQPVVLRNAGTVDGVPRFERPPFEHCLGYYAPGPLADYDRDGRLDVFLPSWYDELPNLLLRNVSRAGHWLTVRVEGRGPPHNTMGIGAIVRVYRAGRAGDATALIGRHDISIGNGYSSGEEALAHIGLGDATACDLVVQWRDQSVTKRGVAADQFMTVEFPAGVHRSTGEDGGEGQ